MATPRQRALVTLRLFIGTAAGLLLIASGSQWGVEPWMRPLVWCRWPDAVWLALACASGLGMVAATACGGGQPRRWLRVAGASAAVVLLLGWTHWGGGRVALDRLCHDEMIQPKAPAPGSGGTGLMEWLRDKGYNLPEWLDRFANAEREESPDLRRLLACSRWPLRRAFVEQMMPQAEPAKILAGRWHGFFPAVLGPDVELKQRRELMAVLNRIRTNKTLSADSQQAATLWMGLVFLTDPPEFREWREPLRDAMLACANPLPWETGDCWMRVLDTLLAFDPPAQWGNLTAPLASWPLLLRRAVRERVRGMACHFDAIADEVEASERAGDWNAALALWLDTGRLLAAHPGPPDEQRIITWRRATMYRWLAEQGLGGLDGFLEYDKCVLVKLPRDAVVRMTPEEEQILATAALAAADQATATCAAGTADEAAKTKAHRCVEHARLLYPYLAKSQQAELTRRIAPALVHLPVFMEEFSTQASKRRFRLCDRCPRFLAEVWPLLPPDSRKEFGPNFRVLWERMRPPAFLLGLDAWSGASCLSDQEWLLSALALADFRWALFQPTEENAPLASIELARPLPIPVPQAAAVRALIQQLSAAVTTIGTNKGFRDKDRRNAITQSLNPGKEREAPPDWMLELLSRWTSGFRALHTGSTKGIGTETLVAMHFCYCGLLQVDGKMREDFRRFFETCPTSEWPTAAMEPPGSPSSGDGIPWEADRLSATLSWASEIKRETYPFPGAGVAEASNGVFSYLAQAFVSYMDEGIPGIFAYPYEIRQPAPLAKWKRQPLQLPLEPTPWQRARALHREHPELPWPERMGDRPRRDW